MAIDHVGLIKELDELRAIAAKKLADDPLPTGSEARRRIEAEIEELGLGENIAELDMKGYTVLPPGSAAPPEFVERLRDTILRIADEERPDQFEDLGGLGRPLFHLVPRDRVFEEAVVQPKPLALMTYLLGWRARLSQCSALIKDKSTTTPLAFHADHSRKIPAPWPNVAQFCVITWVLSDYTRENGALCVFPGSHKLAQDVPSNFVMAHDHEDVEVVEVPAGSLIAWHGSLWHGALPRTADGRRVSLVLPFVRYHVQPSEMYWASTTPEMLERNPARFATLMGLTAAWPWGPDGPGTAGVASAPTSSSPFE